MPNLTKSLVATLIILCRLRACFALSELLFILVILTCYPLAINTFFIFIFIFKAIAPSHYYDRIAYHLFTTQKSL